MSSRTRPHPSSPPSRSTIQTYLLSYNTLSLALWATLLLRLLLLLFLLVLSSPSGANPSHVHDALHIFARNAQTLALLESLHSLFALVRAPVATTAMQVVSRVLLVWGIVNTYPEVARSSWAYTTMLLAWSAAECFRYGFFALTLSGTGERGGLGGDVLKAVTWLRYNAFFVLYPLGIGSECWLIWLASQTTGDERVKWLLWGILGVYVPGTWVLLGHMVAQRRRVGKGKAKAK